jgi:hypothetical protein
MVSNGLTLWHVLCKVLCRHASLTPTMQRISMAEQLSKTARRSLGQSNTIRTPFQVFKPSKPGKANYPVACFASKEDAEALAAAIGGYVFSWRDEVR